MIDGMGGDGVGDTSHTDGEPIDGQLGDMRSECEFAALRYLAPDGNDYPSHKAQQRAIARYVRWRKKHTKPRDTPPSDRRSDNRITSRYQLDAPTVSFEATGATPPDSIVAQLPRLRSAS